jgi:hypothetical protein
MGDEDEVRIGTVHSGLSIGVWGILDQTDSAAVTNVSSRADRLIWSDAEREG